MRVSPENVDIFLSEMKDDTDSGFVKLYEYTYELLYMYALSVVKDFALAEDVVQDTYIKIYRNISKYRPGTNGLGWVIKITKNTAINYTEKQGQVVVVEYEPKSKSHEEKIINTDYLNFLLKKLNQKERQVVTLHLFGDYTVREAANLLGISIKTAEWRYHSALKKLRAALKKEGAGNE